MIPILHRIYLLFDQKHGEDRFDFDNDKKERSSVSFVLYVYIVKIFFFLYKKKVEYYNLYWTPYTIKEKQLRILKPPIT